MTAPEHIPSPVRGVLLATVTAVTWGTVPIAGKIALPGMSAAVLSSLRLLLAAGFMALLLWRRTGRAPPALPRGAPLAALALAGNYVGYMWGVERAGAGTSQVLIQTAPLFLVVLSVVFLGESMKLRQALGAAVAFAGVGLVSWRETATVPGSATGVLFLLAAAFVWAIYAAIHKRLGREHGSGGTIMWISLFAGLFLVPVAGFEEWRTPDGVQLAAIGYLCVNTIVAYWCFAEALRHIDASLAAVICTVGPVVTFLLLGVTNSCDQQRVPHEPLTVPKLLGAAMVVSGVAAAVATRRGRVAAAGARAPGPAATPVAHAAGSASDA